MPTLRRTALGLLLLAGVLSMAAAMASDRLVLFEYFRNTG